jgi:sulfoxide reductase heme-binding subunit YedZ
MRGSGVVSLLLLTLVVMLGVATTRRQRFGRLPRFVTTGLHRNASLLAVAFLALHVVLAVLDPDAGVSVLAVVVPFAAHASTLALGAGAIALDILAAIVVTSLLRKHFSQRTWRGVHLLAYAAWPFAWLHGLAIGSDVGAAWLIPIEVLTFVCVVGSVLWRLWDELAEPPASVYRARRPTSDEAAVMPTATARTRANRSSP